MSNVECRRKEFYRFYKKDCVIYSAYKATKVRSDFTLSHSQRSMHSAKAFALRAGINRRPYDVMLEEIFPFYKNRLSEAIPPFDIPLGLSSSQAAVHYSAVLRFAFPWFFGSLFPGSAVFKSHLQRDSLVLKKIKRSVIIIRRSMFDVRRSIFSLLWAGGVSYVRLCIQHLTPAPNPGPGGSYPKNQAESGSQEPS